MICKLYAIEALALVSKSVFLSSLPIIRHKNMACFFGEPHPQIYVDPRFRVPDDLETQFPGEPRFFRFLNDFSMISKLLRIICLQN
jgi:hypothetical protein